MNKYFFLQQIDKKIAHSAAAFKKKVLSSTIQTTDAAVLLRTWPKGAACFFCIFLVVLILTR